MKKYLLVLVLIVFVIPQIALASWWNPFSWSIFHRKDTKTEVSKKGIQESEVKSAISTSANYISSTTSTSGKFVNDSKKVIVPQGKNFSSIPVSVLDFLIESFSGLIKFNEKDISITQDRINYLKKMRALFQSAEDSGYGDKISRGFVSLYDSELDYHLEVLNFYKKVNENLQKSIFNLGQDKLKVSSLFFTEEQAGILSKSMLNGSYWVEYNDFSEKTQHVHNESNKYYETSRADELEALAYLKSNQPMPVYYSPININTSSYVPLPLPTIPRAVNCDIGPMSGARGYYTISCF